MATSSPPPAVDLSGFAEALTLDRQRKLDELANAESRCSEFVERRNPPPPATEQAGQAALTHPTRFTNDVRPPSALDRVLKKHFGYQQQ